MHSLTEQVTFEWGSEDLLRQNREDLKREHHKQRCDSMRSCSEKGPLSSARDEVQKERLVRTEAGKLGPHRGLDLSLSGIVSHWCFLSKGVERRGVFRDHDWTAGAGSDQRQSPAGRELTA